MKPLRRLLLCRELAVDEAFPGGAIALLPSTLRSITQQQAEIVEVGEGEFDEDGYWVTRDERLRPGAWILHKAFQRVSAGDDPGEFFVNEDDVVAVLEAE